jgi:hypothetical protein
MLLSAGFLFGVTALSKRLAMREEYQIFAHSTGSYQLRIKFIMKLLPTPIKPSG